jgi:hypothetical protein
MAGIIKPKPSATKNETAVTTATSLGRSANGDLNRLISQAPLRLLHVLRLHDPHRFVAASL